MTGLLLLLAGCGSADDDTISDDRALDTGLEAVPLDTAPADTGVLGYEVPPVEPDIVVDCTGAADYLTIGAAIAASLSGTKIGLNPCTYDEDIDFAGKSLNIFGIAGSADTIIRGTGTGAAVKAIHGESLGTRLAGVTVTGGATDGYYGAGMSVDRAVVMLEDVVFTGNDVGFSTWYAEGAFVEFLDVTYTDNDVDPGGGALVVDNGSFLAQRMTVDCDNTDFAIYSHASTMLLDTTIVCGTGHAVYNAGCGLHVRRSWIESDGIAVRAGDSDDTRNERVYVYNSALIGGDTALYALFMNVKAENDVFWGGRVGADLQFVNLESFIYNSYARGSDCAIQGDAYTIYEFLGWNAVEGTGSACLDGGQGSIEGEPGFVDAPTDFTLDGTSPLIDAGDPSLEDADGSRSDIGIHGGPEGAGQL